MHKTNNGTGLAAQMIVQYGYEAFPTWLPSSYSEHTACGLDWAAPTGPSLSRAVQARLSQQGMRVVATLRGWISQSLFIRVTHRVRQYLPETVISRSAPDLHIVMNSNWP